MKNVLRLMTLLCALIMAMTCVGASAATVSEPGVFPIVDEKIELTVFTKAHQLVEDYETNKLTQWYEEKTNIHINWIVAAGDNFATELNLSLSSGDYPDIYLCDLSTDQIILMANNDIIIPIEDLIDAHAPEMQQVFADNPSYRDFLTAPDGHLYTLFYSDIGVHMFSTYKMFVYQPWLDQYTEATGKGMPATTEEFRDMLIYFRDNDMNGNGDTTDEIPYTSSMGAASGSPFYYLVNPFQLASQSGVMVNEDGSVSATFNTEGYRDGLRYINALYNDKLLDEALFVQDSTQFNALVNNAAAPLVGCFTNFARQFVIDQNVMNYYDYTAVPPLEGPAGLRQTATNGYGSFNPRCAITTACEYPEAAIKWLDYWMGIEGSMVQSFGWEEGVDYERTDEVNFLGTTDTWNWLFDSTSMQNIILLNTGLPRNDTNYRRYSTPASYEMTPMRLWEAALAYEPYYVNTGIPALVWNPDEVLNEELSILRSTINNYVAAASSEFALGVRSLDTDWEAYIAELEALGLARYLEILGEIY